jgi:uncharacterized protein (DUF2141 family)
MSFLRAAPILLAVLATAALEPGRAAAQAPGDCRGEWSSTKLRVIVENLGSTRGEIAATLYGGDPDKFLKKNGELKVWRVPARTSPQEMCVYLPGPGTYAMAVYHDANGNHHFDHGIFGPTEAYAFSRNPHLYFGPPNLGQVKFEAGEGETTVNVRLHYPGGG